MKKIFIMIALAFFIASFSDSGICDSIDEISDQFMKEYEALKPPSETSSVHTDYKFDQTALASFYTIKVLKLLYEQNQQMVSKYDEMLQRYEKIIHQNEEIIKILSQIEKQKKEEN